MINSRVRGPSLEHEERRYLLDTVAFMAGYTESVRPVTLNGLRPDVARQTPQHDAVFIGDAKHSESPLNRETFVRLSRYAKWLSDLDCSTKNKSVFALCYGNGLDTAGWTVVLSEIARINKLGDHPVSHRVLDDSTHVLCMTPGQRNKHVLKA